MKKFLSVSSRAMCILVCLAAMGIVTGCPAPEEEFVWHEVGADGEPAFENGWYNTTLIADDEDCGFGKDSFGFVHLKGTVMDYSYSANEAIFTLPENYRPEYNQAFAVPSTPGDDDMGLIYVNNDGSVTLVDTGTGNGSQIVTSLDGITFFAE
ncbi:MAG: hypothetical protein JXJ04_20460 [Spirochaetales bacterium]|nr:hypothetical protein [Spirochaetales bacterium]